MPKEFSSFFEGEEFDVADDFAFGCILGGVSQFKKVGFGLFEEELFGFLENLVVSLVVSGHEGSPQ